MSRDRLKELLSDRTWRLANLYRIEDKDGYDVPFKMNDAQAMLDRSLWHRNCILKSRQYGITTWACIRALDTALFRSHTACGIVAHTGQDASKFFRRKILYAYDRLPQWLRDVRKIKRIDQNGEVVFTNDSRIEVGVSLRSGTFHRLHVSELGKMDEVDPLRAQEVVAGALNTVPVFGVATVESTARVPHGHFYSMVERSKRYARLVEAGEYDLTPLDYKFFFLPWFEDPTTILDAEIQIPAESLEYFSKIETETGTTITPKQRVWYVKKSEEQGDQMFAEFPSTPEEAFWVSSEGAYFAKAINKAEREGRVCHLPFVPGVPVNTFWDIGRSDSTAIWFHQQIGAWHHFIDYFEASGEQAAFYAKHLQDMQKERGYVYGQHYLPHDAGNTDWSSGANQTRAEVLEGLGVKPLTIVPRIQVLGDGIDMVRQVLPLCRFDRTRCGETTPGSGRGGLPSLRAYHKGWNEKAQCFSDLPAKHWSNHGADAFRQFAQGYEAASPQRQRQDVDPRRSGSSRSTPRWMTA